jgi:phage repressor protein C with HTH and peptisase S24 domain
VQSTNLGERLRLERARLGLSQEAFGEAGGVKKFAQSNYERGKRSPDTSYLEKVSKLGVDIQFVVTGIRSTSGGSNEDQPAQLLNDTASVSVAGNPGPGLAEVKLYDVEGAAGAGRDLEGERIEGHIYFPEAQLQALGIQPTQVAGIKVRGDSMENTLADGDWVLVDLANRDIRQEGVFLLTVSGERRIKRVQRLAGGALYLISDNEHYQPEMITPEQMREVEILGRCEVRIGKIS